MILVLIGLICLLIVSLSLNVILARELDKADRERNANG